MDICMCGEMAVTFCRCITYARTHTHIWKVAYNRKDKKRWIDKRKMKCPMTIYRSSHSSPPIRVILATSISLLSVPCYSRSQGQQRTLRIHASGLTYISWKGRKNVPAKKKKKIERVPHTVLYKCARKEKTEKFKIVNANKKKDVKRTSSGGLSKGGF